MKLVRRLAWVVGGFIVLVVVALVVAQQLLPEDRLRAELQKQVREATGYALDVGDISVGLGFRGLALNAAAIELSNPAAAADARRLVALERLEVGVALLPLIQKQVEVTRLVLHAPEIALVQDADGRLNIEAATADPAGDAPAAADAPSSGEAAGVALAVPSARIVDGRLSFEDRATGARYAVGDLDAELAVALDDVIAVRGDVDLAAVEAVLQADGGRIGPLDLGVDFDLDLDQAADRLTVTRGSLRLAALELDLTGRIDSVTAGPRFDLALRAAEFEPARLLPLVRSLAPGAVPEDVTLAGTARVETAIRGTAQEPEIDGELVVDRIAVTAAGVDGPVLENVAGAVQFSMTRVEVSELTGLLAGGPFALSAVADGLPEAKVNGALRLEAKLAEVAARLPLPPDTAVKSGTLDVDVKVTVDAARPEETLEARGTIDVDDLGLALAALEPEVAGAKLRVTLEGRGARVAPFSATVGESDLAGQLRVANLADPTVDFSLRSTFLNLDQLIPAPADEQSAGGSTGAGNTGGGGTAAASTAPPPLLRAKGTVRVDRLLLRQVTAEDVSLAVSIDESGARIEDVTGRMLGGTLSGSATAVPEGDSLRYESRLVVNDMQANELLTATTPVKNVIYGTMNADLDLAGLTAPEIDPLAFLTAEGNGAVTNGYLEVSGGVAAILRQIGIDETRFEFDEFLSKIVVRDGRVVLDNGKMLSGKHGEFHLGGSVGFDRTLAIDVSSRLPGRYLPTEISSNPQFLKFLADDQGRVPVKFSVTGNLDQPKVKLDLASLQAELSSSLTNETKSRVKDEAGKAAKSLLDGLLGGSKK